LNLMKIMSLLSVFCAGEREGLQTQCMHGRDERPRCAMNRVNSLLIRSYAMWTKPEYTEMRFGFEVTMYVFNR